MSDGFLHKYFLNNSTKLVHKWIHYFDIYERHFERFRGKSPVMVEIGVFKGGSLAMWKDYFGAGCKIVGIDVDAECKAHEATDIEIVIGSQEDPNVIEKIFSKYPNVDIVLDDGSHLMPDQFDTFNMMYDRIQPRGVYVVEDTHTSYWSGHNTGRNADLGLPDTFMEFVKTKLDDLHAVHTRGALPVTEFTKTTDSITIYDSVVVFEKRPQGFRQAWKTSPLV